jgi:hypothetical protein
MPRAIFPCCTRARAYSICISLPVLLKVVKEKFMSPIPMNLFEPIKHELLIDEYGDDACDLIHRK